MIQLIVSIYDKYDANDQFYLYDVQGTSHFDILQKALIEFLGEIDSDTVINDYDELLEWARGEKDLSIALFTPDKLQKIM